MAAFHFAWVEQGGTSLYDQFVPYISSREVLRIVSSIYATEAVHYAIFRDSLNGITAFQNGANLVVPDLTEGEQGSSHVFPKRCTFLSEQLPTCSVIRPSSTRLAGAQAAANAFIASNLFKGQPPGLLPGAHGLGQGRRRRRLTYQPLPRPLRRAILGLPDRSRDLHSQPASLRARPAARSGGCG